MIRRAGGVGIGRCWRGRDGRGEEGLDAGSPGSGFLQDNSHVLSASLGGVGEGKKSPPTDRKFIRTYIFPFSILPSLSPPLSTSFSRGLPSRPCYLGLPLRVVLPKLKHDFSFKFIQRETKKPEECATEERKEN